MTGEGSSQMYGEVHVNRVFCKNGPLFGDMYRQIAIVEGKKSFEVQIRQTNQSPPMPTRHESSWSAQVHRHKDWIDAVRDVERETTRAFDEGWTLYDRSKYSRSA